MSEYRLWSRENCRAPRETRITALALAVCSVLGVLGGSRSSGWGRAGHLDWQGSAGVVRTLGYRASRPRRARVPRPALHRIVAIRAAGASSRCVEQRRGALRPAIHLRILRLEGSAR